MAGVPVSVLLSEEEAETVFSSVSPVQPPSLIKLEMPLSSMVSSTVSADRSAFESVEAPDAVESAVPADPAVPEADESAVALPQAASESVIAMIGSDSLILVGNDLASLLCPDADLDKGGTDIFLDNVASPGLRGIDCRLVQEIFKIRTRKAGCGLGNLLQIHILAERLVLGMDMENFFPSFDIRHADRHFAVKASRTQNSRIQNVDAVGRCHDNDAFVDAEAVHFHEELIQRLLPFIMASFFHEMFTFQS